MRIEEEGPFGTSLELRVMRTYCGVSRRHGDLPRVFALESRIVYTAYGVSISQRGACRWPRWSLVLETAVGAYRAVGWLLSLSGKCALRTSGEFLRAKSAELFLG